MVAALALLAISGSLAAQKKVDVVSVKTVVQLMERGLQSLDNMTADYVIDNDGYRNAGTFFYKKPFFIRLNSSTDASQIVSNGKLLWVFLPYYGIVAEQDLAKSESEYTSLLGRTKNLNQLKQSLGILSFVLTILFHIRRIRFQIINIFGISIHLMQVE